ncbi:MAG: polyphosphate kinase 1 [Ignavibacteriales bacterium]|nr:MAG: polyphosphate kinase 1 [Ignavibacteriaceae bacterium]MBW7872576.1 polyphosphate kinase 1 [Ignavibacteria bacterium]MCZ2141871.1 polyphosphate kinase 1 [Ignavibacteriales bacterium]MBV6445038.1 Polyphosphate kinase [Ignavibacteriaceae bacterium]MBZ0197476.1 polyphosphate kinase 1 [Ignavibacteriaceae bacterium]
MNKTDSVKQRVKHYLVPENFINRELSWIEFNKRVLEEAFNQSLPLLDRIKFISIFSSNLDEFYMIRVSGIKEQIEANISESAIDGLSPMRTLHEIEKEVRPLVDNLQQYWADYIVPELAENGISITTISALSEIEKKKLDKYFEEQIFPVLTPLALDPGRPFPYISNLSLSLAVTILDPEGENRFARVKVPGILPRLLRIDTIFSREENNGSYGDIRFIWLEDLIRSNISRLFPKMTILDTYSFRITRDTDMEIQEDEADDLLEQIEENIRQRMFGNVVRLEVEHEMPQYMLDILVTNLELKPSDVYPITPPLGLSDVMSLYSLPFGNLKEKPYIPRLPKIFEEEKNIFQIIKQRDVLLHHPYDAFKPVVEFIKQASRDPDVLAIKQTLYRVGRNSPVVDALIEAAENRKQVAVLVELKARFDEENNIYWAKQLESVGVHVVYGLIGLKTHAKMTLVVRREQHQLCRYVHVSTGNYNSTTAKLYTDLGLFTCHEGICNDVSDIFNILTGYSAQLEFRDVAVAPINLRQKLEFLIAREIQHAKNGNKARIILKLNSLVDQEMIGQFYEASAAGVKIDLIVRGICCLIPGLPGISENITVRSIVGRYLEHSRIFYFLNNGEEELYLSSADIMPRNLDRRVELMTPVYDRAIKNYLRNYVLETYLNDNIKARVLTSDKKYSFAAGSNNEEPAAQEMLMNQQFEYLNY